MIIVTTIAMILSYFGYGAAARMLHVHKEFIPILVLSSIGCATYICGIFNQLETGSFTILAVGLALLLIIVAWRYARPLTRGKTDGHVRRTSKPWLPSLFDTLFVIGIICFVFLLHSSRLVHYDNFSHWAIALKEMLLTNAFPTVHSELISFLNYPLGTTSFLYYVCSFAGHSQAVMILGQSMLIFAAFYAVFGIIEQQKRFLLYAFLACGCSILSIFNITIRINTLLVDFILPVLTLAILAIAYRYGDHLVTASAIIAPIAAFLMIVKVTGIVFASIALLYLLQRLLTNKRWKSWANCVAVLGFSAASFCTYALWQWHLKITGIAALSQKFSSNATDVASGGSAKTGAQIHHIITAFTQASLDLNTRAAQGILAANIIAIVVCLIVAFTRAWRWNLWKCLIATDIVLALYYVGILALYIYSMPQSEAQNLAGFDRYSNSIVVLFVGALFMCATIDIERSFRFRVGEVPAYRSFKTFATKNLYQQAVVACTAIALSILLSEYNGLSSIIKAYPTTLPATVSQVTADAWPKHGAVDTTKYLIYGHDTDGQATDYYMQYVVKYYLYAPHVDAIVKFYEPNMDNLLRKYQYLVVLQTDSTEMRLLQRHYGVSGSTGFYRIVKSHNAITLVAEGIR
ncbi:hypothetical protein [Bifidobacterium aquikefiricola]|uniref:ABC transporter permease n=1 Tax=Bifidobacterium aquikefiricola TaxID=3059038 RepID=A0AB39U593_9BIFI